MDLNAIMNSIVEFFTTDFGRFLGELLNTIYKIFFPANAPDAVEVPLPNTQG